MLIAYYTEYIWNIWKNDKAADNKKWKEKLKIYEMID